MRGWSRDGVLVGHFDQGGVVQRKVLDSEADGRRGRSGRVFATFGGVFGSGSLWGWRKTWTLFGLIRPQGTHRWRDSKNGGRGSRGGQGVTLAGTRSKRKEHRGRLGGGGWGSSCRRATGEEEVGISVACETGVGDREGAEGDRMEGLTSLSSIEKETVLRRFLSGGRRRMGEEGRGYGEDGGTAVAVFSSSGSERKNKVN